MRRKIQLSAMISKNIIDFRSWSRPGMQGGDYIAPLYLYPETTTQTSTEATAARTPNLNIEIVNKIAENLGLQFVPEENLKSQIINQKNIFLTNRYFRLYLRSIAFTNLQRKIQRIFKNRFSTSTISM
jgi:hypothetical protein